MLELVITLIIVLLFYIILYLIIPFSKIFKGIVLILQIFLCLFLFSDNIFYKTNELWKNPEVYQQFHQTNFFPIKNIKVIYSDNEFKNFEYEKADDTYSITNKDSYTKECIQNYFIKENDECPITDIIIEKEKKNIYTDYNELNINNNLYIYYTNKQNLKGKLYEYAMIKYEDCDNKNEKIYNISNNCFQISFYSNFDYLDTTSIKNKEDINLSNPFKNLKDYSKYSDILCLSLLIFALIYTLNEPYGNKTFNYFKIISSILILIVTFLFLIRYIKFTKIKKFYNEIKEINELNEESETYDTESNNKKTINLYNDEYNYTPKIIFNFDSFPLAMSLGSIIIILFYFITPEKCHCCCLEAISQRDIYTYPLFQEDANNQKTIHNINFLVFPINIIFIIIFVFDILNDNNIRNDYGKMYNGIFYNWETYPIKSIQLSQDEHYLLANVNDYYKIYNWKKIYLKIEKINNYNYINLYGNKKGKKCGKDNQNNDLYFPEEEECPINGIFLSQENKTVENFTKVYLGGINGYLYYTNQNINGKIIIDIKIGCDKGFQLNLYETNELCEYLNEKNFPDFVPICISYSKTNTIPFYEKIDNWDACELLQKQEFCEVRYPNYLSYPNIGLYAINYQGINSFKVKGETEINNLREKIEKYFKLSRYKYIFDVVNIIIIIYFNVILLKKGEIPLYLLCLSIIFITIILIYIIICGMLVKININYIQNFLNVINVDFEKNNNDSFWIILLLLIEIYFFIYDIFVILYRFLLKDKLCNSGNGDSSQDHTGPEEKPPIPPPITINVIKKTGEKDDEDDEKKKCIICYEREPVLAFIPCGHKCVCQICYNKAQNSNHKIEICSICRKKITNVVRIYDV